jgi:crotonobetainyl-CoA:carnitine CoA-transferase CaiB-like acyl-CoA transferase
MVRQHGPLAGIRVVETGGLLAEFGGKLLAGMGARVVKVEPPGGALSRAIGPFFGGHPHPDRSTYFWHFNQGKESVALDLTERTDREALGRLVRSSDILLSTSVELEAAGIGAPEEIHRAQPRLIQIVITPWGRTGPYADFAWSDLVLMAMGGHIHHCGYDEEGVPPVRGGGYQSVNNAGNFVGQASLLALIERERSGEGQIIDIPVQQGLVTAIEMGNLYWHYNSVVLRRQTGRHAAPPSLRTQRTQHLCRDGRYANLMMRIQDKGDWNRLVSWLKDAGLEGDLTEEAYADPAYRARPEVMGHVQGFIEILAGHHDADDFYRAAQRRGLIAGAVRRPEELFGVEHLRVRSFFHDVPHPELGRAFQYPGGPWKSTATEWDGMARAPLLGEHTARILQDLGLEPAEAATLLREQAAAARAQSRAASATHAAV